MHPAGLEPATPGLGNRCSIQLSYGRRVGNDHFSVCSTRQSQCREIHLSGKSRSGARFWTTRWPACARSLQPLERHPEPLSKIVKAATTSPICCGDRRLVRRLEDIRVTMSLARRLPPRLMRQTSPSRARTRFACRPLGTAASTGRSPRQLAAAVQDASSISTATPTHVAAELPDQIDRRARRAAGREQVVDDQDLLALLDRIAVHLEAVGSVLQVVADADLGVTGACRPCGPGRTRRRCDRRRRPRG